MYDVHKRPLDGLFRVVIREVLWRVLFVSVRLEIGLHEDQKKNVSSFLGRVFFSSKYLSEWTGIQEYHHVSQLFLPRKSPARIT